MKSQPLAGNFGIEFFDVNVAAITEEELELVKQAQNEHGVVFFRDQDLDCDGHVAFARRLDEIVVNRFFERVDGYEEIAMVRKEPRHKKVVGECWHTDHSYDQAPARGSILYAREVPSSGGDTFFANMYMVYESLSDGLKQTLEGMRAVHSSAHVFSAEAVQAFDTGEDRFHSGELAVQTSVHPVILVHPQSGRRALYVNPDFTVRFEGWTEEESAPLLNYLYEHSTRDEFVTRFDWRQDSIAFWDNRAVMHRAANDYPRERRLMHRITLKGVPLTGVSS